VVFRQKILVSPEGPPALKYVQNQNLLFPSLAEDFF
jgi:hypothetical protein